MVNAGDTDNTEQDDSVILRIERPVLTNDQFNRVSERALPVPRTVSNIGRSIVRKCKQKIGLDVAQSSASIKSSSSERKPSCLRRFGSCFIGLFPFINVLRKYEPKKWLVNDLVAGLTVGIMHVPQGMAYALLATLPPVFGLYTSFFPPLVYFFFGTSAHISMGTIAVVSLLTGDFLDKVVKSKQAITDMSQLPEQFLKADNSTNLTLDTTAIRIFYAPALTLTAGLTQILMGILRLGGLTRYFSTPMTSGFTVGVAVHVFSSQIKNVFGISIKKAAGLFTLPLTYLEIFKNLPNANIPTVIISAICITILAVYKDWINPRIIKYTMIPLPMDLIVVIICTVCSYYLDLHDKYHVKIVGEVTKGIQPPEMPTISEMGSYIGDIIVVAVVAFSVTVSLAQIFAARFNYRIDTNQELIAYGLANTVGSFFHTYPTASSLSRSAVQVSAGCRTQVTILFSSALLIMVLCFIGPLFYNVPTCSLAAIILVALKSMFKQAIDLKYMWEYSVWDSAVWIVTFICTVFLSVSAGLLIGVIFSALCMILRTQTPKVRVLGQSDSTEIYSDLRKHGNCFEHPNIKVVCYEGNVFYACGEYFRQSVYQKSGVDPNELFAKRTKLARKIEMVEKRLKSLDPDWSAETSAHLFETSKSEYQDINLTEQSQPTKADESSNYVSVDLKNERPRSITFKPKSSKLFPCKGAQTEEELQHELVMYNERLQQLNQSQTLRYLILDCSYWTFMDFTGADELKQLVEHYSKVGINIILASLKEEVAYVLIENDKLENVELYLTVHDAVLASMKKIKDGSNVQTEQNE